MKKSLNNKKIVINNARVHNLKNISVEIPRNTLTVVTGVSGSGKSSLAFDTLYAEGQRRFVESLTSYARQFLERMDKPDVDSIEGLPPAIAIRQYTPNKNPRSTVGTSTEIYDYIRLLYGRIGKTYCYISGNLITKDTPQTVLTKITKLKDKRIYILAHFDEIGLRHLDKLSMLAQLGYYRFFDMKKNEIIEIDDKTEFRYTNFEDFYVLIDRLKFDDENDTESRILEGLEVAFKLGSGRIQIYDYESKESIKFNNLYEDPVSGRMYVEPEPRLFSFNNPYGACPVCQGFGRTVGLDENLVVPDKTLTLSQDAISPFASQTYKQQRMEMIFATVRNKIPTKVPYNQLSDEHKLILWEGDEFGYDGIYGFFSELEEKNYKIQNRITIAKYRGYTSCPKCSGSRLRTSARQVFINGVNVPALVKMSLDKAYEFISNVELSEYESKIVGEVLKELKWRLGLLLEIGLEYLSLDRLMHTLSGGETQRLSLSSAIGSSLTGTLYVLDEPSIGMHTRDTDRLLKILNKLKDLGNTVVVVEHDIDVIESADYLIDIGPKSGIHGGELIHQGDLQSLLKNKKSITASYLSNSKKGINLNQRRKPRLEKIEIINALENNLNIDKVEIPLGVMACVTGVSGSGKSSLISEVLYNGLNWYKKNFASQPGKFDKINGVDLVGEVEFVDQNPIGKSSRSTPATYTKVFDYIREEFANCQESKQLGYKAGYFSFNVTGGRCETCEGEGVINVDMQFLSDVTLICEDCGGTRYKRDARNIKIRNKSIVDVLNMTVDEAIEFFAESYKIVNKLKVLSGVGLGYIKLGQSSSILSGGEAQRIKLAGYLDTAGSDNKLLIFDEPTTGLHPDDISRLLNSFEKLIAKGHSLIIIEHNLNVIASSDYIIDIGPEAGINGGKLVAFGTPEEIARNYKTHTAIALQNFFKKINHKF